MNRLKQTMPLLLIVVATMMASGLLCSLSTSVTVHAPELSAADEPFHIDPLSSRHNLFTLSSGSTVISAPSNASRPQSSAFSLRLANAGTILRSHLRALTLASPLCGSRPHTLYYVYALHHMRN